MPEWSCRTAITLHEESRWKNQKKGNGILHRYRLPTPAKVHSLLARNNLFTRIVNCAPSWSLSPLYDTAKWNFLPSLRWDELVEADQFQYLYQRLLLALSFSETGEFILYLQECYLGRRISWLRSTWIYSFCVPHLPMFKHPPIPQWKEMLFRDQRKLVPRQKDLVRRVEVIPQDLF